jgi:hypothetical protein
MFLCTAVTVGNGARSIAPVNIVAHQWGDLMIQDKNQEFLFYFKALNINHAMPEPKPEFRFDPIRKWRFDWAWPEFLVAVEVEGGTWNRGAHVRGGHYESDLEKYNAAASNRWLVLRYTPTMLNRNPEKCIGEVFQVIALRKLENQKMEMRYA